MLTSETFLNVQDHDLEWILETMRVSHRLCERLSQGGPDADREDKIDVLTGAIAEYATELERRDELVRRIAAIAPRHEG